MPVLRNVFDMILVFFKEFFIDAVKRLTIIDIIDILVLAAILFLLYRFMRDRRAGKLMIGIGLILVLLFIANALEMKAITYLIGRFYQLGLIALFLVLQPEMRAALEKVGGTTFAIKNAFESNKGEFQSSQEIVDAVFEMSKNKVGALIVVKNLMKIELKNQGTAIDAVITSKLLQNLFYKDSPLHDGAVLIENNRIAYAGAQLHTEGIESDLGMRHRAAITTSKICDGIVIVASEQTGTVSVAQNGKLTRNLDKYTLLNLLNQFENHRLEHLKNEKKNNKSNKKSNKDSSAGE